MVGRAPRARVSVCLLTAPPPRARRFGNGGGTGRDGGGGEKIHFGVRVRVNCGRFHQLIPSLSVRDPQVPRPACAIPPMYLSGLPPPRPPRLHFVIFAKAIIPFRVHSPGGLPSYLFLIGVHRGGIGQCSSFQDTIPLFGRRVRLSGRVEAAAASTRDWQLVSCRLLSSGGCVHRLPVPS